MTLRALGDLASRIAVCIAVTYAGFEFFGLIGVVLTAPIWGVMLAKPILEFFPVLARMAQRQALEEWEGKYYKYERTHLRVYFDGGRPWFVAEDVLSVLEKEPRSWLESRFTSSEYAVIPGRREMGFSPEGVMKLCSISEHPQARKFRLWFERAVIFTLNRKEKMRLGR